MADSSGFGGSRTSRPNRGSTRAATRDDQPHLQVVLTVKSVAHSQHFLDIPGHDLLHFVKIVLQLVQVPLRFCVLVQLFGFLDESICTEEWLSCMEVFVSLIAQCIWHNFYYTFRLIATSNMQP
jgi:hypothetical protein